jgi:hypothetical protein
MKERREVKTLHATTLIYDWFLVRSEPLPFSTIWKALEIPSRRFTQFRTRPDFTRELVAQGVSTVRIGGRGYFTTDGSRLDVEPPTQRARPGLLEMFY